MFLEIKSKHKYPSQLFACLEASLPNNHHKSTCQPQRKTKELDLHHERNHTRSAAKLEMLQLGKERTGRSYNDLMPSIICLPSFCRSLFPFVSLLSHFTIDLRRAALRRWVEPSRLMSFLIF